MLGSELRIIDRTSFEHFVKWFPFYAIHTPDVISDNPKTIKVCPDHFRFKRNAVNLNDCRVPFFRIANGQSHVFVLPWPEWEFPVKKIINVLCAGAGSIMAVSGIKRPAGSVCRYFFVVVVFISRYSSFLVPAMI